MKKIIVLGITFVIAVVITITLVTLLKPSETSEESVAVSQNSKTEEMIQRYYQNAISLQALQDKLKTDDSDLVYFFSPKCPYCKAMTPVLMAIAKEYNVDVTFINVLEDENAWDMYNIQGTPTTIYFKNGQEVDRMEGYLPEQNTRSFFDYYFK